MLLVDNLSTLSAHQFHLIFEGRELVGVIGQLLKFFMKDIFHHTPSIFIALYLWNVLTNEQSF